MGQSLSEFARRCKDLIRRVAWCKFDIVAENDCLISTDMISGLSRISQPCTLQGSASVFKINRLTIPSGR
jgi:hypothetical protein